MRRKKHDVLGSLCLSIFVCIQHVPLLCLLSVMALLVLLDPHPFPSALVMRLNGSSLLSVDPEPHGGRCCRTKLVRVFASDRIVDD